MRSPRWLTTSLCRTGPRRQRHSFREHISPRNAKRPNPGVERRASVSKNANRTLTALAPTIKRKSPVFAATEKLCPRSDVTAADLVGREWGRCAPRGRDTIMAIDRNAIAKLAVRIRRDRRLSPTARNVGNAALFAAMSTRTGRCQAYRARLAHEAGCSKRSVTRATQALQEAGYLAVVPTWGKRYRSDGRRWYRPREANVLEWRIPANFFVSAKLAADPSSISKPLAPAPLPEGLSRVLQRLGSAMADRAGLPTNRGATL